MDDFPLSPFLKNLEADGFNIGISDYERISRALQTGDHWSIGRLRGVLLALLAKNPQQAEIFKRRFDHFFASYLTEPVEYSGEEIELFLEGFRPSIMKVDDEQYKAALARWRLTLRGFYYNLRHKASPIIKTAKRYLQIVSAFIFLIIFAAAFVYSLYFTVQLFRAGGKAPQTQTPTPSPGPERPPDPAITTQPDISVNITGLLLTLFGLFIVSMLIGETLMFLGYKKRQKSPPKFNPEAPRLFSLNVIGGGEIAYLDPDILDSAAGALNYFATSQPGKRLDLKATVDKTARKGGLPTLIYEHIKQLRYVYIFEDAYAEPLAWNHTASELAKELSRRGVPVRFGKFLGIPENFYMLEGDILSMESLHDSFENSLFLFFSDGKQLTHDNDSQSLQSLSRLPFAVWLDLRDPGFWDESARFIEHYKIPLFPSTATGIRLALESLLSGQRKGSLPLDVNFRNPLGSPVDNLSAYTEYFLGEALPWAQACAMMQPLPLGLANLLRERFHPLLPPQRIELLFRLPGSTWEVSGLKFSLGVLNVLRTGFASRLTPDKQRDVLQFIISQICAVEPPEKNSLRHLAWEWALERVRLEFNPDATLPRIERLLLTPLADHIRAEFSHVTLPGTSPTKENQNFIPLRAMPATKGGKRILFRLAPHLKDRDIGDSDFRSQKNIKESDESQLARTQTAIADRIRRNPSLKLWGGMISTGFEAFANYPYQKGERDIAGYPPPIRRFGQLYKKPEAYAVKPGILIGTDHELKPRTEG